MRKIAVFLPLLCLAACTHGVESTDAVRQGVLDYLSGVQTLNLQAMDVKVESVQFKGHKADAAVSIFLKGSTDPFMKKTYHLEQKAENWVVIPGQEPAGHGMAPAAGAGNPHGGAAVPQAGGKMPSPDDLPPAGKK